MKITVIGSANDHGYSDTAKSLAASLGKEIARRKHTLLYGPELQMPSLPYLVARSCKDAGGLTVGIAIGSARTKFHDPSAASIVIYTEGAGGAGREVILANSADGVIAIGGGAGTLTELSIAYMNYIPVVVMKGSGGWSDKLAGTYLDDRKKFIITGASDSIEALNLIEKMHQELSATPSHFDKRPG